MDKKPRDQPARHTALHKLWADMRLKLLIKFTLPQLLITPLYRNILGFLILRNWNNCSVFSHNRREFQITQLRITKKIFDTTVRDFFFQRSQSWVNSLPSPLDSLEFVSLIDANLRPFPSRSIIKNFHITPRIKYLAFKFIDLILAKLFKRKFNLPFEFCGASVKDFGNEKCHYHLLIPIATKYFLMSVSPIWVKPVWSGINQKY